MHVLVFFFYMHDNVECVYHEFAQWVVGEFLEDLPLPKE